MAALFLPAIATYAWRGFGAGLLASLLVWAGTFMLWGQDEFGWDTPQGIMLAMAIVMYQLRRYLPSAGTGHEVMPGWHSHWFGDARARWHDGGTGGFCSYVGFVSDSKVAVAVLSNSANDVDTIGVELLRHVHETNKVWAAVPRTFRAG